MTIPTIGLDNGFAAMGGAEPLPILWLLSVGMLLLSVSAFLLRRRPRAVAAVYHCSRR
jgi:hypothetical protein